MLITDLLGRPLKNLRLSVTDRCNLRCSYCMPEAEYVWLPRQDLLQYEEMSALIDVFSRAGVDKIRITGGELRFIEYMDVGGATQWSPERVMSREQMLAEVSRQYGAVTPVAETSSAPADRFTLPDGTVFGIISSTTEPFCRSCDRSRLTADGMWYRCLYATNGTDLRAPLRAGQSREELLNLITKQWSARADRGAEERLSVGDRAALVSASSLKKDPHLEMHTRGG